MPFNVTSFDEIIEMESPSSEKWLIDGIIPETGLHLLMGAEKLGKSWFNLQCAHGIATGGLVFGKIPVNKNKVLFISLEESKQLLQKRAKRLNLPKTGENLEVVNEINHRQYHDVAYALDQMLVSDPSIRFVIIDTIQLFLDVSILNDKVLSYHYLQNLKDTAYGLQVSILMVHYSDKIGLYESMESVTRSLGRNDYIALFDTIIFLTKMRSERRADLFVTGSETMGKEYILRMDDNCGWVLEGDKREVVEGETQKLIADWIKKCGGATPIAIYRGLKAEGYTGTSDTIRQTCYRMRKAGKLRNGEGRYYIYAPFFLLPQPENGEDEAFILSVTDVTVSQPENEGSVLIPPVTGVTVSQPENEEGEALLPVTAVTVSQPENEGGGILLSA